MIKNSKRIRVLVLTAIALAPLTAAAATGVVSVWVGTKAGAPAPQMIGVPSDLRENLENFDDLDFRVYSGQQWQDLHITHTDNVIVHWPDGHTTQGLAQHIEDLKWMFTFSPTTKIKEHPVRFGSNEGEWTAVTSWLEGKFEKPMPNRDGSFTPPTGNSFRLPMVTVGHWNPTGVMDEEYLFWDNQEFYRQLGLTK